MRRLSLLFFFPLMIASAAYIVGTNGQLPSHVAMHFGSGGQVSGSVGREAYLLLSVGFATLFPLFLVASIAGLPLLTSRNVRLPNRDYWLAPPRRDETLAVMGAFGGFLGCVMTVFAAAMHYVILEAHRSVPPQLPEALFWTVLGGFFVATISWQTLFYLRFRSTG